MTNPRGKTSSDTLMHDPKGQSNGRIPGADVIERVAREAVREALRRHMLLGESVAVADENGGVKMLGPDEIREALKVA